MTLTKDMIQELRKPFHAEQVKWKVQTQPKDPKQGPKKLEGWGVVVSYLDARDVAERLDSVVGSEWSDNYELFGKALECSLTVCGVTRKDVGEADSPKELYSDAFKRAAVKFGVGAFLYRMPTVMAKMARKDEYKPYQLTPAAASSLKAIAKAVSDGEALATKYADLMLLSEYQAPEPISNDAPAPQQRQAPAPRPQPQQASKPVSEEGGEVIGVERAKKLHAYLGAVLKGTPYGGTTGNDQFVNEALGREVRHWQDITPAEAKALNKYTEKYMQDNGISKPAA